MSKERKPWSEAENLACVDSYLSMLLHELRGEKYSKTLYRKALLLQLNGRSAGSVEFKHCNISAIMQAIGLPYVQGYKPRGNFQLSLKKMIVDRLPESLLEAAEVANRL